MNPVIRAAGKAGAAQSHVRSAIARLGSRNGYTFTRAEIDYLLEHLENADRSLSDVVGLLEEGLP